MGKFRTFLALDSSDRGATLEALCGLAAAQARVRLIAPRKWRTHFGPIAGQTGIDTIPQEQLEPVRRVRMAITRAARNLPTDPNCLPQALAARRMLQRRGIDSSLFLGVERDPAGQSHFHAWLKVGPEWVTGMCDEARYVLLREGDSAAA
ncbi:lasso peptide biosynthesis B2 protein [Qipengyuania sp. XHP0207]|uniref:lasso peptide biosynthesis B2 protein n=1 Tax=Qipengyuania sp. XHP0207 TaxID=3038078 RepID=UPI00241CF207|nr:lasso peptide biosynthesis B2 protein [Qipengyuania sp. XHP0207]MDG5746963.1 lasso peptide biosynthesis B2 protein [Qipengyuania sp. XHP0207]